MADPNELLANLAKSKDARLVEGFPVVLANALEKHRDKLDLAAAEKLLDDESLRTRFRKLTALSLYLFDVFGLEKLRPKELADRLGRGNLLAELRNAVERNEPLPLHPGSLDLERVLVVRKAEAPLIVRAAGEVAQPVNDVLGVVLVFVAAAGLAIEVGDDLEQNEPGRRDDPQGRGFRFLGFARGRAGFIKACYRHREFRLRPRKLSAWGDLGAVGDEVDHRGAKVQPMLDLWVGTEALVQQRLPQALPLTDRGRPVRGSVPARDVEG